MKSTYETGQRIEVNLYGLDPHASMGYWYAGTVSSIEGAKVIVKLDIPLRGIEMFTVHSPHRIKALRS